MDSKQKDSAIVTGLFVAVFLWGAGNTAAKYLTRYWPPVFSGWTRFMAAGLLLFALLRWTRLFGKQNPVSPELNRRLWWRGGLTLALYIACFYWAVKLTAVSHVALYLGAAPVWALLWEGRPGKSWRTVQRYGAAVMAFIGVITLLWPSLSHSSIRVTGECLGLVSSVLWTNFGRQIRSLGSELSGPEISAHTFCRAGVLLAPVAAWELFTSNVVWHENLFVLQLFCVIGSGVIAFALWNNALRHWPTSQVYLFNNMVPITTMGWAWYCLDEPVTKTFWTAMVLIGGAVVIGQTNWQKIFGAMWTPPE